MSSKKFEIFRLGTDGEIHRHLICLGGRVSVFRANREALLEEFRVALQGKFPVAQFRIALDGVKFNALQHVLIGFDEKFALSDKETVNTFLERNGLDGDRLEGDLKNFGLGGLGIVPVSELSDTQQRVIRLLGATAKESDRVLILNDPFEGLTPEFQELLAMRVADFTYRTSAVVIISRLSSRPENWIDNPLISRVQLERPRRETIGSGGMFEAELAAIRAPHVPTPGKRELTAPPPAPPPPVAEKETPQLFSKERLAAITPPANQKTFSVLLAAAYLCVFASLPWLFRSKEPAPPSVVRAAVKRPVVPVAPQPVEVGFRGLPKGIQDQVMLAFRDPDALLRSIPARFDRHGPALQPASQQNSEPPQRRIDSAPGIMAEPQVPQYNPPPPPDPSVSVNMEEIERRREEIRQKLLSAIMARRQELLEQQQNQQQSETYTQ